MSETQTVTIADFLLARIAEDEEMATSAAPHYPSELEIVAEVWEDCAAHLATHSPARVLAECEAKRRIVEDFVVYAADYRDAPSDFAAGRRHAALLAVTRLVEPHADHPDFDPDWRP